MASNIPPNLGFQVTTRTYNWGDEVRRQWGAEWARPDVAYEMSNSRKFDSTDRYTTGIYAQGKTVLASLILQNFYGDAPAHLKTQSGWKIRLQQDHWTTDSLMDALFNPFVLGQSVLA